MLIRLYDIELNVTWKSSLEDKPLLKELYSAHSEVIGINYYGFQWDKHPQANPEEWARVFKEGADEEKEAMLQKYPKMGRMKKKKRCCRSTPKWGGSEPQCRNLNTWP